MGHSPEEIRLRYLYRSLILRGRVRLPMDAARNLVGPDCAFHLYAAGDDPDRDTSFDPGPAAEAPDT
jgi:hypothetical protein